MSPKPSKLLAYLQLFRLPNVFTAIADVAMAYLVTAQKVRNIAEFAAVIGATCLLYTAGMVLNDVFDYAVDLEERPQRPLPAGKISRGWAKSLGFVMLATGVGLAWAAGLVAGVAANEAIRTGSISVALAACILTYNAAAKKTIFGPLVMGACRFFNILMGMGLHAAPSLGEGQLLGFGTTQWMIAGGIGIYIVGVTVFARSEAKTSARASLALGVVIMAGGIAMLAAFPRLYPAAIAYQIEPTTYWPLGLLVISFLIFRRCVAAIVDPQPVKVQIAIKFCLMSLIILDGTLCAMVCPLPYALSILALLIPMLILGRWVYST